MPLGDGARDGGPEDGTAWRGSAEAWGLHPLVGADRQRSSPRQGERGTSVLSQSGGAQHVAVARVVDARDKRRPARWRDCRQRHADCPPFLSAKPVTTSALPWTISSLSLPAKTPGNPK